MATAERTLTDFLQHSGDVLPDVERGEVVLRRRSGDDVVLVARRHWRAVGDILRALAEEREAPNGSVRFALPWLSLLGEEDRRACLDELRRTAVASLESGGLAVLADTLSAWRASALATWDQDRESERMGYAADEPESLARP